MKVQSLQICFYCQGNFNRHELQKHEELRFPAQSVEIFNERRISTTQVDEACGDTSDCDQCYLCEINKRFCETYQSPRAL